MILKLVILIILVNFRPSLGQFLSCNYRNNDTYGYTCDLTIQNPNGLNNFASIGGTHLTGKTNNDVRRVLGLIGSNTTNVPSIICDKFQNSINVELYSVGIKTIDDKAFKNSLNVIYLHNNKLKITQSDPFRSLFKLKTIYLQQNQIEAIDEKVIDNTGVQRLDITNNLCANQNIFDNSTSRMSMRLALLNCFKKFDDLLPARVRKLEEELSFIVSEFEDQNQQLTATTNQLQVKVNNLTAENIKIRSEMQNITKGNEAIRTDVANLNTRVDTISRDQSTLKNEVMNQTLVITEIKNENQRLTSITQELKDQNQELRSDVDDNGRKIEENQKILINKTAILEAQINDLTNENRNQSSIIKDQGLIIADIQNENQQLHEGAAEIKDQIVALVKENEAQGTLIEELDLLVENQGLIIESQGSIIESQGSKITELQDNLEDLKHLVYELSNRPCACK
ncbi:unnamed protein product [Chironomus riparius]|uniref:Uncharacterized protein n=1 Tax=Chironomus riparius TaxID=315576 RepID=A0A9N9RLF5_9DIPT|nr:unnamed protein product [Chironomus riparius]